MEQYEMGKYEMEKHASVFLAAFVGAFLAIGTVLFLLPQSSDALSQKSVSSNQLPLQPVSLEQSTRPTASLPDLQEAAQLGKESVVHIRSINRNVTGIPATEELGSGVIISDDGLLITNHHVIKDADKVIVTLPSLFEYEAEIIGFDSMTDLALLKIPHQHTIPFEIGNSNKINVGDWVLAIGNPLHLSSTVTAGIISGIGRSVNKTKDNNSFECFIQSDAALNKGSSGGALVDNRGKLIGINTAIASESGNFEGYSFSIPINVAMKVAEDLEGSGVVQRAFLGVQMRNLDYSLDYDALQLESLRGVYVSKLLTETPKGKGLYEEDIIRKINGVDVCTIDDISGLLMQFRPGQKIEVTVIRDQEVRKIESELKNIYNKTGIIKEVFDDMENQIGAKLSNLSPKELESNFLENGIQVTKLLQGLLRDQTNIEEGFIITKINNREVRTVESFFNRIRRSKSGDQIGISGFYADDPEPKNYQLVKP